VHFFSSLHIDINMVFDLYVTDVCIYFTGRRLGRDILLPIRGE
jgi:hypothetical protein